LATSVNPKPLKLGLKILLLPLYTILKPRESYARLRRIVRESSPGVRALASLYAFIGFSLLSTLAIILAGFLRAIMKAAGLHPGEAFSTAFTSLYAAFLYPFLAALILGFLDTILILVPVKLMERDAPDYLGILLIRFSSLIAYAVKPGYIAASEGPEKLGVASIYGLHLNGSLYGASLLVTLFTYIMTAWGLVRSGGTRWRTALVASAVPIIAHIAVGLA